jgi:hypothetical protein
MSLTKRKPRPLTRDSESFRDDRYFIVACDDTFAPKQYFGFFKIARVKVHVVPTEDGTSTARRVLERLQEFDRTEFDDDDEFWMLLDTDHCVESNHFPGFIKAIIEARQNGINIALSKPCFELWLLLHHVEEPKVKPIKDAKEAEKTLREELGQYNKAKLQYEHFPLTSVAKACVRAQRLDTMTNGGDNPSGNTSRVYLLWKSIVSKALPSQLPKELHGLFQ